MKSKNITYYFLFILAISLCFLNGCSFSKEKPSSEENIKISYEDFIKATDSFKKDLQNIQNLEGKYNDNQIYQLQYLFNLEYVPNDLSNRLLKENKITNDPFDNLKNAINLIDFISNENYKNDKIDLSLLCHSTNSKNLVKYLNEISNNQKNQKKNIKNFYDFILSNKKLNIPSKYKSNLTKYNKLNSGDQFIVYSLSTPILLKGTELKIDSNLTKEVQNKLNNIQFLIESQKLKLNNQKSNR